MGLHIDQLFDLFKGLSSLKKWDLSVDKAKSGLAYLKHYGYFDKPLADFSVNDILDGVSKFQEIAGLKVDGDLGPKTLSAMNWPRCGVKDFGLKLDVEPLKWGISTLRYYIEARDTDLSVDVWDATIAKSFNNWSKVAKLTFIRVDSKSEAHLICSAGSSRSDGFDGPNGTLAWAQLPPSNTYTGQLLTKVDRGETWIVISTQNGILLENVLSHEFGHLLGLDHSSKNGALMAPFYNPSIAVPQMVDDIPRIQALYGAAAPLPPVPPTPTPSGELVITIKGAAPNAVISIPGYRVQKIG